MTDKREFPRDMSFVDRQGNVVNPSRADYDARKSSKTGEAYAFFDCNASYAQINAEIPTIRKLVQAPNHLELTLMEGFDNIGGDSKILEIAREAKDAGLKYTFQARYPNATNKQTADEVAGILNQAYQSPLYENAEPFRGGVFYKQGAEYISRD